MPKKVKSHFQVKGNVRRKKEPPNEGGHRLDDSLRTSSKRSEQLWLDDAKNFIHAGAVVRIVAHKMHSNDALRIDEDIASHLIPVSTRFPGKRASCDQR